MKYLKLLIVIIMMIFLTGCDEEEIKTDYEFLREAAQTLKMEKAYTENFEFVKEFEYEGKIINVSWVSNKVEVISNFGVVKQGYENQQVGLTATFTYNAEKIVHRYLVIVPALTAEQRFNIALKEIAFDELIEADIKLNTKFYDEEIIATWSSSHPDIISNEGKYNAPAENTDVILTVTLELGSEKMEKEYCVKTKPNPKEIDVNHHLVLDDAVNFDSNFMENCHIEGKYLVLNEGAKEGTYVSNVFNVDEFKSVVGSWGALSSKDATVELEVRCLVDNKWSMYFSYGEWGLGLENKPMRSETNDSLAKISTDEIIIKSAKGGSALQYRVTLRRNTETVDSPKLELVALAIEYKNYSYPVDTSILPTTVTNDVPMLRQGIVPEIGGSICSPTSATMLLKYKGLSFADKDEYEHRYIAYLARDYGNEIFGNWVYNTVTISSYGIRSYTMRMYSLEELQYHLANVGPVALSVKGKMVAYDKNKSYTTGGHLLVATGYYIDNGKVIFKCNDPAVSEVYVEYAYETIEDVWRMVAYIVE